MINKFSASEDDILNDAWIEAMIAESEDRKDLEVPEKDS